MQEVEPAQGLELQTAEDEDVLWAVERDLRAEMLSTLTGLPQLFVIGGFIGAFTGMLGGGVLASVLGIPTVTAMAIGFAIPLIGVPVGALAWTVIRFNTMTIQYAATTSRFIEFKEGLSGTDVDSIKKENVRDVEMEKSFVDNVLGTMDVSIESERGHDSLSFEDVPESNDFLNAVQKEAAI